MQNIELVETDKVCLSLKREDLLHPTISGNKFRKLKYNLLHARKHSHDTILTYGGAFSNHIAATAAAGHEHNFRTIGIIRGEELGVDISHTLSTNPTLKFAASCGMKLHFISRKEYRRKDSLRFRESVLEKFNNPYLLPEGGTNKLAIRGCEEILSDEDQEYDFICCSMGTGGTAAGIINSVKPHQQVLVFPALKGNWIEKELRKYIINDQFTICPDYHFGGYAKVSPVLVKFMNDFKSSYNILLDPIYTAKMMYGIFQLIEDGFFPENSRILAIHTGGLQGIAGINLRLEKKGLPLIKL